MTPHPENATTATCDDCDWVTVHRGEHATPASEAAARAHVAIHKTLERNGVYSVHEVKYAFGELWSDSTWKGIG